MDYRLLLKDYMKVAYKISGKFYVYDWGEFGENINQENYVELAALELEITEEINKRNYKEEIHKEHLNIEDDGWREAYFKRFK